MDESKALKARHITISIIVVLVFLIPLLIITPYLISFFRNPQDYFGLGIFFGDAFASDFQVAFLCILFYSGVVLIGYITYLLATSSTRAGLISEYQTKNLLSSKFELEELYENAPLPYFTINKEGEIRGCNKSALRFFGVVPEEIAKKNFFAFAAPEDAELGEKFFNFYKADSPIDKQEIRVRTKNDGIKWVSLSIFLTKDSSTGEKNGLVTAFDIYIQSSVKEGFS
ncbi:MAG: PAS domain-containing protein, partial [archaeon]